MRLKGSRSKKCTLPSDYLTKKELRKMNGECKTWNMNHFYSYEEFKKMPTDIQEAYLVTLTKKYKANIPTIARNILGVSPQGFRKYLKGKQIFVDFPRIQSKEGLDALFMDILTNWSTPPSSTSPFLENKNVQSFESTLNDSNHYPNIQDMTFRMKGFDMDFIKLIKERVFSNQEDLEIVISITKLNTQVVMMGDNLFGAIQDCEVQANEN